MRTLNRLAGIVFGLMIFSLFLTSCSRGFKTDFMTGLKMTYSGLSVEDCYLTIDESRHSSNQIPLGKEVVLILENVTGFQMKDGIYTIGFETTVTDPDGNYLLNYTNTLTETEVSMLRSLLTVGEPMVTGKTYQWTSTFTDRNGEGVVKAILDIEVTE